MAKNVSITVSDKIELHDNIKGKIKNKNSKKKIQFEMGDSLYKKTHEWNYLERIIDWKNNHYFELIKDKYGIRTISEPLSDHTNHGDAKYKKTHHAIQKMKSKNQIYPRRMTFKNKSDYSCPVTIFFRRLNKKFQNINFELYFKNYGEKNFA